LDTVSYAIFMPTAGGFLDIRSLSSLLDDANSQRSRESEEKPEPPPKSARNAPDPYAHRTKWAAWKISTAIILFSGLFWIGVAYLISRLFGH
jgi:hypothetical protein